MKKYLFLLSASIFLIFQFSCNSNKADKTDKVSTSTGKFATGDSAMDKKLDMECATPVLTATINGNHAFKSCNADAHLMMDCLNFFGTSGKDIIGINFFAKMNDVKPGTYKIGNYKFVKGNFVTAGQPFSVSGGFFLDGSAAKNHYETAIDGTITLEIADGKRYKGTYEMTVQQKETKEILKVTDGTFDLQYNEKGNRDLNLKNIKIKTTKAN